MNLKDTSGFDFLMEQHRKRNLKNITTIKNSNKERYKQITSRNKNLIENN